MFLPKDKNLRLQTRTPAPGYDVTEKSRPGGASGPTPVEQTAYGRRLPPLQPVDRLSPPPLYESRMGEAK